MKGETQRQKLNINTRSQLQVTNEALKQLNDRYAYKISRGDIQMQPDQQTSRLSADKAYDKLMKQKKIAQAQKEKQELQKKLQYLNRSIQSIKTYDYTKATVSQVRTNQAQKSPLDIEELKKRQTQLKKKLKESRKKSQQRRQQQRNRQFKLEQQELQKRQKQMAELKAKKQQQILSNMQKIKTRMDNRQNQTKKHKQQYKKIIEQQTLFKKLQENFTIKQNAMLEQRKKKLADIRDLHKPISLQEIEEHQRKFTEIIKEKESMRQRQRRLSNLSEEYRVSYKSPAHLKFSKEKEEQPSQSRLKLDKMKQFSTHVRENFVPDIDNKKRHSIESLIQQEQELKRKSLNKKQEQRERAEEIRSKGLRYLEEMRDLPKKRQDSSRLQVSMTERPKYKNYITHSQNSSSRNWKSILSANESKQDKAIKLHFQSERFESSMRLKEQKARLLKGDCDAIDRQYFEMIRAKLDLLQT